MAACPGPCAIACVHPVSISTLAVPTHAIICVLMTRSFRLLRSVWLLFTVVSFIAARSRLFRSRLRIDADLAAHRRVPIAEVEIDTRLAEAHGRGGAPALQAQIEAAGAMPGVAGRHRVLDVVRVGHVTVVPLGTTTAPGWNWKS